MVKISFCTTCMGRLYHLVQTLPLNILSTAGYANREFVVLNYNSNDGLHEWAMSELKPWIASGVVKYYRTLLPQYFVATHAKNIAHRQATGDILCNVDADNFISEGFCEYLVSQPEKVVVAAPSTDFFGHAGSCGKIAVRREYFYSVNGYDEDQCLGWGWDDTSFQYRVRKHNDLEVITCDPKWCRVINHSNAERVANFVEKDIEKSKNQSIVILQGFDLRKDYIANKDKNWGYVSDISHQS